MVVHPKDQEKDSLAYMRGYFELQVMSFEYVTPLPPHSETMLAGLQYATCSAYMDNIMMSAILTTPMAQCKHNEPKLSSHQYVGIVFLFCHWEQRHDTSQFRALLC